MKRFIVILLFILPLFLKAQSGCSDPGADNYYCNSAFDCVFGGVDENNIPIWTLPPGFVDDDSCYYNPGCTDSEYVEYDTSADFDDGSCQTLIVEGCIEIVDGRNI